ncbi:MAG: ComEC/Rec2 family competence protein, partial [Enterococcus sp.]|nr:ComEC/Rec2 family competence protein [Enterococcus sp.]
YNPVILFNSGFQISCLCIFSLSIILKKLKFLPSYIGLLLSLQIGTFFYNSYMFNYFSLGGFLVNWPTTFVVGLLVPICLILFILFSFFNVDVDILSRLMLFVTEKLINLNGLVNDMPYSNVSVSFISLSASAIAIPFIFFLFSEHLEILRSRKKYKNIGKLSLSILIISLISSINPDKSVASCDVIFMDVGQGDGVHLKAGSKNYIIDGGGKIDYNLGKKTLKPYFLKNGVGKLDGGFFTHNHTDHFKATCELSNEMPLQKAYFSVPYSSKLDELSSNLHSKSIRFLSAKNRLSLSEDCYIDVLWPLSSQTYDDTDENGNSLILKIVSNGKSILMTGDITSEGEAELVEYYKGTNTLKCDILKISHHGSRYSSSDEFIDAVSPSIAIIQVGQNTYGHPTAKVLEKLKSRNIKIYRNDLDGAIGIDTKNEILVNKMLN